jgi:Ca2+/Na+ antiporter
MIVPSNTKSMKRIYLLATFVFISFQIGNSINPTHQGESEKALEPIIIKEKSALSNLSFDQLMTLKPKQIKAITGEKLKFKERLGLMLVRAKYKKAVRRSAKGKGDKDSLSVVAFIFSIVGLLGFIIPYISGIFALVGLILGIVALTSPERYQQQEGRGLAIWAVIIGGLVVIFPILILAILLSAI